MEMSCVSGMSWLQAEATKRKRTYLEEALWSLGISPPADASLIEQGDLLCNIPIPVLRAHISDRVLLLALAELEGVEIHDIEQCARIRTFASRVLFHVFGYEVTKIRKVVLSACATIMVGPNPQPYEYVRDFFRSMKE